MQSVGGGSGSGLGSLLMNRIREEYPDRKFIESMIVELISKSAILIIDMYVKCRNDRWL